MNTFLLGLTVTIIVSAVVWLLNELRPERWNATNRLIMSVMIILGAWFIGHITKWLAMSYLIAGVK